MLEPGMGEWWEKTSLKKCHGNGLLNGEVESAICTSGAKVFQAEAPDSTKVLRWKQIRLYSRNKKQASVAGI